MPALSPLNPTVIGATAATGGLTLTVSSILLPSGQLEPAFVVTFDSTTGTTLINSPLDGIGCNGCLKTTSAPATYVGGGSAGPVAITYLDTSSAGFPLNYSTLGMWTKDTGVSPWTEVGGPFSAGVLTRGIDLPTTGTAAYHGYFIGRYVTSDTAPAVGTYLVGANAKATVDFSASSGNGAITSFSTSSTQISQETSTGLNAPQPDSNLNLSTTKSLPITRTVTSNSFSGVVSTTGGATGQINGAFYGPSSSTSPPPEMGGSLAVSNSGNTQTMVGGFALKR